MIDPPWLFLDANSGYAEHYPAKQRGQPGYNHSRGAIRKNIPISREVEALQRRSAINW
jgi:hypothetical protein